MECGSFHRFFHCFSLNPLKYPLSGDDITGETKNPQKVKTCIVKDDNRYGQQNRTGKEETMSVNGVTSTQAAAAYSYHSTRAAKEKTSAEEAKTTTTAEDTGVIYEHSTAAKTSSTKKTYTPDTNPVSYTHLDVYKRQLLDSVAVAPVSELPQAANDTTIIALNNPAKIFFFMYCSPL